LRESEAEKYVLQKKIRLAEENAEASTRKLTDEVSMLKQQLDSLRNSNASSQEKIRRLKRFVLSFSTFVSNFYCNVKFSEYDELNEKHSKSNGLFQSVESKLLAETADLKETITKKVCIKYCLSQLKRF
jgi:translation initiation factor 2B subunit (eIF-2B alpha/beta/delta family)